MPRRRWRRRNRRGTSDASDTRCGRHDGCAQAMNTEIDLTAYLRQHETGDLLRFITCGSVDDGKSTLIGRLLHDTRGLYDDQLTTLAADSRRHGSRSEEHTSELQSLMRISYAVFCLTKKKNSTK